MVHVGITHTVTLLPTDTGTSTPGQECTDSTGRSIASLPPLHLEVQHPLTRLSTDTTSTIGLVLILTRRKSL